MIENFRSLMLERNTEQSHEKPGSWKLSQCVRILVDNIDYWSYLVTEHGKDEKKARWKYSNIEYFIRMIENWESDPDNLDSGLYAWLNRISLITRDDGEDDLKGKVNLSTIHAAKGLEFPVVFIAGAEKGLIPHEKSIIESGIQKKLLTTENTELPGEGVKRSNNNPSVSSVVENLPQRIFTSDDGFDTSEAEAGSLEEERRLFYVAITRAREKLFITSCRQRRRMQSTTDCEPSPFLTEIPPNLIKIHEKTNKIADEDEAEKFLAQIKSRFT
jgi:DNA helicase-2/ATP-dependent DNA helicase PcrA